VALLLLSLTSTHQGRSSATILGKDRGASAKFLKCRAEARQRIASLDWPAPGSEDTELGVLMELEVGHGETEVYAGVQA
jgi:hypothetical protein